MCCNNKSPQPYSENNPYHQQVPTQTNGTNQQLLKQLQEQQRQQQAIQQVIQQSANPLKTLIKTYR